MRVLLQCLLMVCVAMNCVTWSHDLRPLGELPTLDADWELLESDSLKQPGTPVRWIVFRNKVSGDLLSLATYPPEGQPKRSPIFHADTALECFPDGRPAWNRTNLETMTHPILSEASPLTVTKPGSSTPVRVEVLKYCFVTELKEGQNLMAVGYCWSGDKAVVYVQHTSARPITAEFVERTTRSLIQKHSTFDAEKPRE
jgi:hypothetical protein